MCNKKASKLKGKFGRKTNGFSRLCVFLFCNYKFFISNNCLPILRHKTPHVAGFKVVKKNPQIYKYVAGLRHHVTI